MSRGSLAWADALRRAPGVARPLGGIALGAAGAGGQSLTLGDFTVKAAEKPYVMPQNLIWTALPGEGDYIRSLRHLDPNAVIPSEVGSHSFDTCSSRNAPSQVNPNGVSGFVGAALKDGKRFFHGGGVWGCTESSILRGIISLLDRWIIVSGQAVQLTGRQRSRNLSGPLPATIWKTIPQAALHGGEFDVRGAGLEHRWPIEIDLQAKALQQELLWARETFVLYDTVINAYINSMYADWQKCDREARCLNPTYRDPKLDPETFDKIKALIGFTTGSQDLAVSSLFGARARPLLTGVHGFIEKAEILIGEVGGLQEELDGALASVVGMMWSAVKDFLLENGAVEDIATFVGTVADSVPFVGQWVALAISLTSQLVNSWTKDDPEFGVGSLYRGRYELSRKNLEIYVTMMYRAVELQYQRLYYLVQVPESSLIARFRPLPPMAGGGRFRPGTVVRPPAGEKALTAGGTGLLVGSGVAAAALVWWLWLRRR